MVAVHEERVALVGLPAESLDIIHLVRESGRGEVRLVADRDPLSRVHSLAAVFRVPSTPEYSDVERSGCGIVVVPDAGMAAGEWISRWAGAGARCLTFSEALRFFSAAPAVAAVHAGAAEFPETFDLATPEFEEQAPEFEARVSAPPEIHEPPAIEPSVPLAHQLHDTPLFESSSRTTWAAAPQAPAAGEPKAMHPTVAAPDFRIPLDSHPALFPASLRAAATHLEQFLHEQRSAFDAAWAFGMIWDDVLGDLVSTREILDSHEGQRVPAEWAMHWVRRAWTERRALVFQESSLTPVLETPHRARAFVALPLGDEGILYLEDAWLPLEPAAREREELAHSGRRWADELAASRAEQRALLRKRIHERLGGAVFDLLPESDHFDPWPGTAAALADMLEADAVVFHFRDGGAVFSQEVDPGRTHLLTQLLSGKSSESLRAVPLLAARARSSEGQALRAAGVASFLGWARGEDMDRVAVGAFRFAGPSTDEFDPEHLTALKKMFSLAHALSRAAH